MRIQSQQRFRLVTEDSPSAFQEQELSAKTNFQSRAPRAGADFKSMALHLVTFAGGKIRSRGLEIESFPVDALVEGPNRRQFLLLARGTPDEQERGGLRRTDTVEKVGFVAMQLADRQTMPILIVTSDLPGRRTKAGEYLASLSKHVWDIVAYRNDLSGYQRLVWHLSGPDDAQRPVAPWRASQLMTRSRQLDLLNDQDNGQMFNDKLPQD